jgi:hypothetical protein
MFFFGKFKRIYYKLDDIIDFFFQIFLFFKSHQQYKNILFDVDWMIIKNIRHLIVLKNDLDLFSEAKFKMHWQLIAQYNFSLR